MRSDNSVPAGRKTETSAPSKKLGLALIVLALVACAPARPAAPPTQPPTAAPAPAAPAGMPADQGAQGTAGLQGLSGAMERVVTGEFDLFALDCGSYEAHAWQQKGAPVGHVIPSDAATVNYLYMGMPRTTAHPNAARLWINFLLSREAQDLQYEYETVDHHLVPGSKTAGEIAELQAKGVRFAEIDVQFMQRQDAQDVARIRQALLRELQKQ